MQGFYRFGITKTYLDLFLVLGKDGKKLKDLSDRVGISRSHLTSVLWEYERSGFIEKNKVKDKEHILEITLTEKGLKLQKILNDMKQLFEVKKCKKKDLKLKVVSKVESTTLKKMEK